MSIQRSNVVATEQQPRAREPLSLPFEMYPIVAAFDEDTITVYQAYCPEIAQWATVNQKLGGEQFLLSRASWIKPGFLWMMHRSGWASKKRQERVLSIRIRREFFDRCVSQAVLSSYDPSSHVDLSTWRSHLKAAHAVIQWDPDHDMDGRRMARRAIQIGLRRDLLRQYAQDEIVEIIDITKAVREIRSLADQGHDVSAMLPDERPYQVKPSAPQFKEAKGQSRNQKYQRHDRTSQTCAPNPEPFESCGSRFGTVMAPRLSRTSPRVSPTSSQSTSLRDMVVLMGTKPTSTVCRIMVDQGPKIQLADLVMVQAAPAEPVPDVPRYFAIERPPQGPYKRGLCIRIAIWALGLAGFAVCAFVAFLLCVILLFAFDSPDTSLLGLLVFFTVWGGLWIAAAYLFIGSQLLIRVAEARVDSDAPPVYELVAIA